MKTIETTEATLETINHSSIQEAKQCQEVRAWAGVMEVGDCAPQGDVNLVKLPDDFDFSGLKQVKVTQLAPGNTQGSRHTISLDDFDVYEPANFGRVEKLMIEDEECFRWVGYALKSKSANGVVMHPEHADHEVAGANIQCYIQVDSRTQAVVRD